MGRRAGPGTASEAELESREQPRGGAAGRARAASGVQVIRARGRVTLGARFRGVGGVRCQNPASNGCGWKRGAPGATSLRHHHPSASQAPGPHASTFLHYRTSKVRMLRAAHLERLVRELVSVDREQDPGFVPAFLATHQAFVPTARVLGLLLPPPPPPLPPWSVPMGKPPRAHPRPSLGPPSGLESGNPPTSEPFS